jgi:hypothetical protein
MTCRTCERDVVKWEDFAPFVRAYNTDIPVHIAAHFVRVAALELLKISAMVAHDIYVDVQENVHDYEVVPDDGYTITAVRQVLLGDTELLHSTRKDRHASSGGYTFDPPCTIVLGRSPMCDQREGLLISATVVPSLRSCSIDSWVYDRYAEDIATGALARILLTQKASYSDKSYAGIMQKRWNTILIDAKVEAMRGRVTGPSVVRRTPWV